MGWLVAMVAVLVVLAVLSAALKGKESSKDDAQTDGPLPYRRRDYLLTKGEAAFYHVLREAVEDDGRRRIFAKVRVMDLVWLPKGTERLQSWKNRVMSKHVDFVVCDSGGGLRPLVAVELDDSSHEREDRRGRDRFIERVCSEAGLKLVRFPAKAGYSASEVRAAVLGEEASVTPASRPATPR